MREVSLEQIKERWNNLVLTTGKTLHLYIDNPFCLSACKYCIYHPNVTKIYSDVYNKYYNEYLPSQIEDFRDILEKYRFDSVYFGGGTSSFMSASVMKNIFNSIPHFKDIPCKLFEAHPVFLNKEKMDILVDNNFSYVSLGVQSFDKDLIESQNRIYVEKEKIKELVDYMKASGIAVNVDLLAFMKTGTLEDLDVLKDDLEILADFVKPSTITIYPMYQRLDLRFEYDICDCGVKYETQEEMENNYNLIFNLRKVLFKFLKNHREWYCHLDILHLNRDSILRNAKTDYQLTTLPREDYFKIKVYSSSGFPHQPSHQYTLALGGFNNRKPYSYFGREFMYETVNDNWKARYFVKVDNFKEIN